jgi:hypothetical protein
VREAARRHADTDGRSPGGGRGNGGTGASAADKAPAGSVHQQRARASGVSGSARPLQAEAAGGPKLPAGSVARRANGAVPQEGVLRSADGVSAISEGKSVVKFDEAADDNELLLHVFTDTDANKNGVISRVELDRSKAWTGGKEVVEVQNGAVQGGGESMNYKDFKMSADKVRAFHTTSLSLFLSLSLPPSFSLS